MANEIEAIATNNYVLATQQAVTHDNSMSGNGTVDSPLGVVPGYNETVLWENTNSYFSATNSTGQFAYPLSAFEAIEFRCSVDNISEQRIRFSSPAYYTKNLTVSWQEFYQNYRLYYLVLSTNGNSFTGVSNCMLTTNGTVNQNLTVAQSNWQYGYVGLKKIVGINRKAQ